MQIALHIGAHFTEEDRLSKCLLRNRDGLAGQGISVPGRGRYRSVLREALAAIESGSAPGMARATLLGAVLDDDAAKRVVLSIPSFSGPPRSAIQHGQLYPFAAGRLQEIGQLFADDEVELYLGLRSPASFLCAICARTNAEDPGAFMGGLPPDYLRWSLLIADIRKTVPQMKLTVWCSEDLPLIWASVIRQIAGLAEGTKIVGGFDLLSEIMSAEGMKKFRTYLRENPQLEESQKRPVISAFLEQFVLTDQIEEVLDLPGWTEELVESLSTAYDKDVAQIAAMSGVNFIVP